MFHPLYCRNTLLTCRRASNIGFCKMWIRECHVQQCIPMSLYIPCRVRSYSVCGWRPQANGFASSEGYLFSFSPSCIFTVNSAWQLWSVLCPGFLTRILRNLCVNLPTHPTWNVPIQKRTKISEDISEPRSQTFIKQHLLTIWIRRFLHPIYPPKTWQNQGYWVMVFIPL